MKRSVAVAEAAKAMRVELVNSQKDKDAYDDIQRAAQDWINEY